MQMKKNTVPNQEPQATAETKPTEASDVFKQALQPSNEANPVELSKDELENVNGGVQAGDFLKPSTGEFMGRPKPEITLEIGSAEPPKTWL